VQSVNTYLLRRTEAMRFTGMSRALTPLSLALFVGLCAPAPAQQKKDGKSVPTPQGTPVMWEDPGDISARDLLEGPGGERPDTTSLVFVREEVGGYSVKWRVRDAAGRVWVAKAGGEARPETASVRLMWAVGYKTETNFLAPCAHIKGVPPPRRQVDRCEGTGFANVRFEKRSPELKRLDNWAWADNPFRDTREFKGLVVMMGLLNNWDLKDDNNKIVYAAGRDGRPGELRYIISDLGATFGKTGGLLSRSRNKPEDYVGAGFVRGVRGGRVQFDYTGKNSALFDDITVADARWLGRLLSKLSDRQIADAFRAANFDDRETRMLTAEVRARIDELVNLPD
jgi:hypothetical protein